MARRLLVEIVGDASSLKRSFGEAEVASEGFGSKLGGVAKTAGLALGAGALGGVALLLDKSVKSALASQVSQAKLDTALKATHQSLLLVKPALDAAETSGRKLGFTNDDTRESLAKLEIATGSTKTSISDLGVAEDLARFKHTDLATASQTLAQAMTGSQRAAKQLGITIIPVTTNVDALKASHENLTTAIGQTDLANAKLADKMATGKDVIQAVTDKVKGQAQAYSDTAAGGMAAFSANIQNLEEGLGNKLLPIFNSVLQWVNDNWPTISKVFNTVFNAIGSAIDALKPVFDLFRGWIADIVTWTRDHWTQIQTVFQTVAGAIKNIINDVVTVVKAVWAEFGSTIVTIIKRTVDTVISVFKDIYNAFIGVVNLITDIIHGKWSNVWDDLKQIVGAAVDAVVKIITLVITDAADEALALGKAILNGVMKGIAGLAGLVGKGLSAIGGAIAGIASQAFNGAVSIGEEIINGIISGIGNLAGKLAADAWSIVKHALGKLGSLLGIGSPSKLTRDTIGKPIAEGVLAGWNDGTANLSASMGRRLTDAIGSSAVTIRHAGAATSPPRMGGSGGGLTIMPGALVVHALDPSSAATAVVEAITVWERRNGQRYARS